jgi:hypothetical protein
MTEMSEPSWNDNPFASPTIVEPVNAEYEHVPAGKAAPLPIALIVAGVLTTVQYLLWFALFVSRGRGIDAFAAVLLTVPAAMLLPTVVGVFRRGRLAYRILKVGTIIVALLMVAISGSFILLIAMGETTFARGRLPNGLIGAFAFTLASVGAVFALDARSVKAYVGLECPRCGKPSGRAADFRCVRTKCKKCRVMW